MFQKDKPIESQAILTSKPTYEPDKENHSVLCLDIKSLWTYEHLTHTHISWDLGITSKQWTRGWTRG